MPVNTMWQDPNNPGHLHPDVDLGVEYDRFGNWIDSGDEDMDVSDSDSEVPWLLTESDMEAMFGEGGADVDSDEEDKVSLDLYLKYYAAKIRYRLKRWMWRALETHYKPGGRGYLKSMEEALVMGLE